MHFCTRGDVAKFQKGKKKKKKNDGLYFLSIKGWWIKRQKHRGAAQLRAQYRIPSSPSIAGAGRNNYVRSFAVCTLAAPRNTAPILTTQFPTSRLDRLPVSLRFSPPSTTSLPPVPRTAETEIMTTLSTVTRSISAPAASSSPIKPILRKPASVLGMRSRSDDSDGADEDEPPTKRQKKTVVFNEDLNMVKDISSKSLEEAKREVKQALEGHSRGDDEDYDNLKELFSPSSKQLTPDDEDEEAPKPQDLIVYVVALSGYAPLLGRSCSGLLRSVLRCAWLERDENFARAYIQLLAALSSVQGSFFTQVLTMMVDKFTETRHTSSVPGFPPVDPETKRQWLHVGLKYLLDLFPAGQHIILNLVSSKFPYTEESKAVHMEYIDHLLRLKAARPELERDIMELILSRLVKLDVEMTLDLENDDDETTRAVLRQLEASDVKTEDEDDESDADSVLSDEDDLPEQAKRVLVIKSKLETMDAILDLLFSIYTPIFEDPDSPEAIEAFQDLLSDFSNVILPVCLAILPFAVQRSADRVMQHLKSRHTQYLLFKFAMKSNHLMEMFIGTLFNLA